MERLCLGREDGESKGGLVWYEREILRVKADH